MPPAPAPATAAAAAAQSRASIHASEEVKRESSSKRSMNAPAGCAPATAPKHSGEYEPERYGRAAPAPRHARSNRAAYRTDAAYRADGTRKPVRGTSKEVAEPWLDSVVHDQGVQRPRRGSEEPDSVAVKPSRNGRILARDNSARMEELFGRREPEIQRAPVEIQRAPAQRAGPHTREEYRRGSPPGRRTAAALRAPPDRAPGSTSSGTFQISCSRTSFAPANLKGVNRASKKGSVWGKKYLFARALCFCECGSMCISQLLRWLWIGFLS